ncbi:sulfatase-like hydrolase/transferase [Methylobacterium sp. J-048]|uniref:sulfatase-like hydrolase/transferase n=1 Tax=Methylobacterium sp. J-048 TaxID=2836635 RepID=UPI001FB8CB4D|nr:sulfatase-like hydrolase/transferase [Methylobacterium sp. J-048]MCJ2060446.1 sulfatase-like hydrolase/transferase [Methylobacterium sp. J-048]
MITFVSRRRLLKLSSFMSLGSVLPAGRAVAQERPNIVFILADDLGYADLSIFGRDDYETPHLDKLARQGIRFTQAYANSAVCSATRTALITGRYQNRLRVGLEEPIAGNAKGSPVLGLPPDHPTLPSLLRGTGYNTTLVGKWHLGYPPHFGPLKSGYDHFFGIVGGAVDYFTHKDGAPNGDLGLYDDLIPVERHGYLTNLLADRAVATIEPYARSKHPFLLSLHFTAPHWPWEGPADEDESKRIRSLWDLDGGSQKTYGEMVRSLDDSIGRVLAALDEGGLTNNTIVVFTSDNGGERFSKTWPFTGMKEELLEGGLRVPVIVRWPGRIAADTVSEQPIISMDWLPTLLEAAGTAPDPAFPPDGESVLPALLSQAKPHSRSFFWHYKANDQDAHRSANWKYLRIAGNEFLFDVVTDPRERANLKDRYPDVFLRLKEEVAAWKKTMLPTDPQSYSAGWTGHNLADHYSSQSEQ